jgi:hypothetical protein
MNIFERLNTLLTESDEKSKVKESDIPIHPEMETKEQGEMAAAEKILKLFQKLKTGSGGEEEVKDGRPEIPDDMIDPMLKERPKSSKEKTFEKNKLAGWDETSDEKIKKEVNVDDGGEDDEFDDFDYRKNPFGDEDNEDEIPEYDDDKTEDEKLKDSIDDAIDSLDDSTDEYGDGDEDDDSGADWGDDGDDGDGGDDAGQQGGEQDGQQGGQQGSKQSGQQGGEQNGESGESRSGDSNDGGKSSTKNGAKQDSKSDKRRRLEELKKSLESDEMGDFHDTMEDIKNSTSAPDINELPGGQIETPSDDDFKEDMKKAGFDDKTIEGMTKKKNIDGNEDYSESEMDELRKDVVNGLEDACKKKGGSALASTIVKNALKRKLNNDEWKEMLKLFLKAKSRCWKHVNFKQRN